MKITLEYLKTAWSELRIEKIKDIGFVIASDKFLHPSLSNLFIDLNFNIVTEICGHCVTDLIDAIWTDEHDEVLKTKRENKMFNHIFISQICDVAVEEYATVCKLLEVKSIVLLGNTKFVERSKELLTCIPNIIIKGITIERWKEITTN